MMWWFFLIPLISAAMGWFFAAMSLRFFFRRVVPGKQPEWAIKVGQFNASLFSIKEIGEKITHPENVKKIMPQAEAHIDEFLRVKLVKSMPVVGMFVGDKTINNLKALFVTELEELFPEIMKKYMDNLGDDFNIEKIITTKISAIPAGIIEQWCLTMMAKELRIIKLLAALLGLVAGLLPVIIIWITTQ